MTRRRISAATSAIGLALCLGACGNLDVAEISPADVAPVPSSTSARTATHLPDPNDFKAREAAWFSSVEQRVQSDFVQTMDPRMLPQFEMMSSPIPGQNSLEEAVDHADLAVLGTVAKTQFVGTGQLLTTFRVERVGKGRAADTVMINQHGTLEPHGPDGLDWTKARLGKDNGAWPLFSGDRAILMLHKDYASSTAYIIQSYSGQYRVTGGRVATVPEIRFHDADGTTENALMARIESRAKEHPGRTTTDPVAPPDS